MASRVEMQLYCYIFMFINKSDDLMYSPACIKMHILIFALWMRWLNRYGYGVMVITVDSIDDLELLVISLKKTNDVITTMSSRAWSRVIIRVDNIKYSQIKHSLQ